MAIQTFPLGSTAIYQIWYDAETEDLWIQFRKNKPYPKYHFAGVPNELISDFLNSSSQGGFYHSRIKGNFYSTEITQPSEDGSLNIFQLTLGTTG